ncbi:MAG: hypothetical protein U1F61_17280 [Opitutaceae bacterium]
MPRHLAFPVLFASLACGLHAQNKPEDYAALEELFQIPKNSFSLSVRYSGKSSVRFKGLGTIESARSAGTTTDETTRTYDDGTVSIDSRANDDGVDLPDDGRTNTWSYAKTSQVLPDESGIAFHTYSSVTEGAELALSEGATPGIDVEYGHQFGQSKRRNREGTPRWAWGILLGFGMSDVNLKTRESIRATLNTLTDTYSLLGSPVPLDDAPDDGTAYSAPSTATETITASDGTTSSFTVDTTTLLGNRPESRLLTATPGGAEIEGFWQIKGAYFTLRSGPWVRWQPSEKISVRLSAGATVSWLGMHIRYDERLVRDDVAAEIRATNETQNEGIGIPGVFSGLEAEWWLTQRTGFFGGATFEQFSKDATLEADGRKADVKISSGLGLRLGITTRF